MSHYDNPLLIAAGPVVSISVWEPKQWQEQLENIRLMRASRDAPVDKIGANKLADPTASPKVRNIALYS